MRIRREGRKVILEPVAENWDWLATLESLDDDAAAFALEKPEPLDDRPDDRSPLDDLD